MKNKLINHYDLLIDENNDPVLDPIELKEYMDKYDGPSFINVLNITKDSEVLEIGVGTGRIALKIVDKCLSFVGVDISSKTINRAKEHLKKYKNVKLICSDFNDLKINNKFDIIYSSLTFMHFENKLNVLKKIESLLKMDGRVVITINKELEDYIDYGTRKIKIYPISKDDFCFLIDQTNFKLLQIIEVELSNIFILEKKGM
jgi:ubiquinone/menaquinone biosynthesis C-methylase UbiE